MLLPDQVAEKRLSRLESRTRVHHFYDVSHRRALPDRGLEQGLVVPRLEPLPHHSLWRRSERLTAYCPRPHYLDKGAQHLGIIDDARKHLREQPLVSHGEECAQQSRHVLHEAPLAAVNRSQRYEL